MNRKTHFVAASTAVAALLTALALSFTASATPIVRDGDTLAFLGDSITQFGQGRMAYRGYVNLVIRALEAEGIRVKPVRAGVSGNKSNDMLARLDRDVLSLKPQFMTLSCGVNDVWHQDWGKGVPLDAYKTNVTAILDKCAAANCTVIILTATMFEQGTNYAAFAHNVSIAPYNDWLRAEAKRRNLPLADLNRAMWDGHAANPNLRYTADGVHMNSAGNRMMAEGVLKALGVEESRFPSIAYDAWEPVWVLCRFDLKPDADPAAYAAETQKIMEKVRWGDDGCIEYRLLNPDGTGLGKDPKGKTLWMFEKWASRRCLKKHGEAPHMKEFSAKVAPMRAASQVIPLENAAGID